MCSSTLAILWETSYTICMSRSSGVDLKAFANAYRGNTQRGIHNYSRNITNVLTIPRVHKHSCTHRVNVIVQSSNIGGYY